MIFNAIVLLCLVASSVEGSAIKGGRPEESGLKGGRQFATPVEQQRRQLEQPRELSKVSEQHREEAPLQEQQTKLEDLQQQYEEAAPAPQLEQQVKGAQTARTQIRDESANSAKSQKAIVVAPIKTEERRTESGPQQQKEEQSKLEFIEPQQLQRQREEATQKEPQLQQQREEVPSKTNYQAPTKTQQRFEEAKGEPQKIEQLPQRFRTEQRHEEQTQYTVQLAEEQRPLRNEGVKGVPKLEIQREEAREKRAEEQSQQHVQQEQYQYQQQQVELTKQDYEQRRLEDLQPQQQQYEEQQWVQVEQQRELPAVKGGFKSPFTGQPAEAEPYAFDYSIEGSSRRESGDVNGVVRGQYTIKNPDGSQRIVDYVADRDGFRARVDTNEAGTESQQPASVSLRSSQPAAQDISLRLEGKTREFLQPPQVLASPPATKTQPQYAEYSQARVALEEPSRLADTYKDLAAPAKGRDEQLPLPLPFPQQLEVKAAQPQLQQREELPLRESEPRQPIEPIKSAELRAPKTLTAELKSPIIQARASGFESATAHRPIVRLSAPVVSTPIYHQRQPAVVAPVVRPLVASAAPSSVSYLGHIASPTRNYRQQQQVSRAQLQHDRYPPLRREQTLNPRASFYASNSEEDQPAGFDSS